MRADIARSLADFCRRLTPEVGFIPTAVPGLACVRRIAAGEKRSFQNPYVAVVLQGRKRTAVGSVEHTYGPGDIVVTCIDFPSFTTIEEASPEKPFLSVVLEMNRDLMTELSLQLTEQSLPEEAGGQPFFVSSCSDSIAASYLRLLELTETPDDIPLLAPILTRELHARLLLSPLGGWIRGVCSVGTHSNQIARAVTLIKNDFRQPLTVADVARRVGLSEASFHRHFKACTGHTPIQYQKILRLYEGRLILKSGRKSVSGAAYEVGYASSSQFTNDYRRFFGMSPREDIRAGFTAEGTDEAA
ncbi:AraC family transcriptional regulator [Sutterella sp.]|uniref:AraC family transcriptional regulator n=1 Tax=Sutterella sp. TaxID=1981025 RepID=UPI0026E0A94F|nr:AraC family transcriptional regulator [Sutterella sp.]MDO5532541.1 AraC family transcriptional regulator [Sutterella sp.]